MAGTLAREAVRAAASEAAKAWTAAAMRVGAAVVRVWKPICKMPAARVESSKMLAALAL